MNYPLSQEKILILFNLTRTNRRQHSCTARSLTRMTMSPTQILHSGLPSLGYRLTSLHPYRIFKSRLAETWRQVFISCCPRNTIMSSHWQYHHTRVFWGQILPLTEYLSPYITTEQLMSEDLICTTIDDESYVLSPLCAVYMKALKLLQAVAFIYSRLTMHPAANCTIFLFSKFLSELMYLQVSLSASLLILYIR